MKSFPTDHPAVSTNHSYIFGQFTCLEKGQIITFVVLLAPLRSISIQQFSVFHRMNVTSNKCHRSTPTLFVAKMSLLQCIIWLYITFTLVHKPWILHYCLIVVKFQGCASQKSQQRWFENGSTPTTTTTFLTFFQHFSVYIPFLLHISSFSVLTIHTM